MSVVSAIAEELATTAREVNAEAHHGVLCHLPDTDGRQLGDLDLDKYLTRYRERPGLSD